MNGTYALPKPFEKIQSFRAFEDWLTVGPDDIDVDSRFEDISYTQFINSYRSRFEKLPLAVRCYLRYLKPFCWTRWLIARASRTPYTPSRPYLPAWSFGAFVNSEFIDFKKRLDELENDSSRFWMSRTCMYGPENDAAHIMEKLSEYEALYDQLEDGCSKSLLLALLISHVLKSRKLCPRWHFAYEYPKAFYQYFDKDLIDARNDHVFVDCGAAWGDTYQRFVRTFSRHYKRMYQYECSSVEFERLQRNMKGKSNVIPRFAGVSSHRKSEDVDGQTVQFVSIDDDIPRDEKITFVKMDIEGSELAALRGAAARIRRDKPYLAICSYHKRDDLLDLSKYIRELNAEYKLYLRYYRGTAYCDTVIYAVP
jgi:hypothetical protein